MCCDKVAGFFENFYWNLSCYDCNPEYIEQMPINPISIWTFDLWQFKKDFTNYSRSSLKIDFDITKGNKRPSLIKPKTFFSFFISFFNIHKLKFEHT